jgi:hypothetical protein
MRIQVEGGDKMFTDIVKILVPIALLYLSRVVGWDPCSVIPNEKEHVIKHDTTIIYVPAALDTSARWEYPLRN